MYNFLKFYSFFFLTFSKKSQSTSILSYTFSKKLDKLFKNKHKSISQWDHMILNPCKYLDLRAKEEHEFIFVC